ncbi:MAG: 39S ribosomal protein L45 [Rickettsiales bacterium]|jgi:predicted lipid-binding transport protein (Tim44 family)|nr:39S ribosomal protein L45 [Rickettsiales bacterium]
MIVIGLLLILTVLLYGILFSSFGFPMGLDRRNYEETTGSSSGDFPHGGEEGQHMKKAIADDEKDQKLSGENQVGGIHDSYAAWPLARDKKTKLTENRIIFDETLFMKLGESMIVAVLEAFSSKRLDILENLLADDFFRAMAEKIESLDEHVFYRTVVVSFDEKILERKTEHRVVEMGERLTLRVTMNQINYVENEDGTILSGSKSTIEKISEVWTFVFPGSQKGRQCWLVESASGQL